MQTRIRPHDPVRIQVDQRPHLTRVLAPVAAKKWPEKIVEPLFPKPSWAEAKTKLVEWGWTYPKLSTMNPAQELYINEIGVRKEAVELGSNTANGLPRLRYRLLFHIIVKIRT